MKQHYAWLIRLSLILTVAVAGITHAKTVFDPTNFAQNTITAANSIRTEISTATQAIQSVRHTIELVKSTMSVDGLARIAGLEQELGLYRDLVNTNQQLVGAVDQTRNLFQNLQSQFGASNVSWRSFLEGRAQADMGYAQALLNQYEAANRAIESTNRRREQILNRVQTTSGQVGATQMVSAQVDILIGQNQQIMNLLATSIANDNARRTMLEGNNMREATRLYDSYNRRLEAGAGQLAPR